MPPLHRESARSNVMHLFGAKKWLASSGAESPA
jgi:hypothetical protein